MPQKIEISHRTIIFTVFFLIFLWFLFQIRQILLILFISLVLMTALEPSVERVEKLKIPRWGAILLIYLFLFFLIFISLAGIVPPLIDQTTALVSRLPSLFQQFSLWGIDQNVINSQISQFGSVPVNLIKFLMGVFSNILTVLAVAVITFYLLMERGKMDEYFKKFFSREERENLKIIATKIEKRLGRWVRGQLTLMAVVGLLSYFGFRFLGIDFALPLAILAGLLEIIPNIGPTIAAIPAILAGLVISPVHALATTAWCFLVQQIENSFIVPKVMQKAVGISPLITIISLAIGFRLAGIVGAVLVIPVVLVLEVIFSEIYSKKVSQL